MQQPTEGGVEREFWKTTAGMFLGWFSGIAIGSVLGNVIGDSARFGLDAVFPAALLAIIGGLLRTEEGRVAALTGAVIFLALFPVAPAGLPIIMSVFGVGAAILVERGPSDMMSTFAIIALMTGVWGQRLAGAFLVGSVLERRPALSRAASLIPAAVVTAVIIQLTVTRGPTLVADARLAGVVVAGLLVWRKAPFIVVVIAAAATTALLRSIG